jgi:hypothetical protein
MLTPGREHPDQQRRQGGGQPEVQEVRKSLPYVHAGKETTSNPAKTFWSKLILF